MLYKTIMNYRTEHDSMGEVQIPADVYYGAQTQRAIDNFPISGQPIPKALIHALGIVKKACARANKSLDVFSTLKNKITDQQYDAIVTACQEVADGKFDDQFPIDIYQTGSGTSSNMNANEVIANRAIELSGGDRFDQNKAIHPNDHVNCGQSTNDIFPTAIHVACAREIMNALLPALREAARVLASKADEWKDVLKIGRTHLADATPMTLGQEFSGFARQLQQSCKRASQAVYPLLELPAGGTAVGTGINAHKEFGNVVAQYIGQETGLNFTEAENHFEANAQRDALVEAHSLLKAVAVTLFNVANNIRFLGSGPRCGYNEIVLPDLQPGSSIMPGKINPVLCESLMQVCARVMGNDFAISQAGAACGQFQLNIGMPFMGATALESIKLLANATDVFTKRCLTGLQANADKCSDAIEKSLSMVTGLNPYIGYEKAAKLAKQAFAENKTIRQLCMELGVLPEDQLNAALDPSRMAGKK